MKKLMKWSGYLLAALAVMAVMLVVALKVTPRLSKIQGMAAPVQQEIVLTGVRIWQSGKPVSAPMQVWVRDGRFVQIAAMDVEFATTAPRIAADGQFLVPGLIDAHSHILQSAELAAYLRHGVTTVRNLNGRPFHLVLREQIQLGSLAGSRMLTTGPTLNTAAPLLAMHQIIDSPESVKDAVQAIKAAGYDGLKIYDGVSAEIYAALLNEAKAQQLPVAGHIPAAVGILQAVNTLDTIEHVDELWQNGWPKLSAQQKAQVLQAATGKPLVASLAIMQRLAAICGKGEPAVSGYESPLLNPLAGYFGRQSLTNFAVGAEGCTEFSARVAALSELVLQWHHAGGVVVLGSDQGPHLLPAGVATLLEAQALQQAGLNTDEVMQAATTAAAKAIGQGSDLGQIAPGYVADALLLGQNPLQTPPWQQMPQALLSQGRYYDKTALASLEQAAQQHDSVWLTLAHLLEL
jgi:imidazolonepropionase-like amidohydrolase